MNETRELSTDPQSIALNFLKKGERDSLQLPIKIVLFMNFCYELHEHNLSMVRLHSNRFGIWPLDSIFSTRFWSGSHQISNAVNNTVGNTVEPTEY